MKKVQVPVEFASDGGDKLTHGMVWVGEESNQEAMKQAGRGALIAVAIGLACLLIPLLHFILVPGFLIAAAGYAWFRYQRRVWVLKGEGQCPHCQASLEVSKQPYDRVFRERCDKCFKDVEVHFTGLSGT